jgi:hypothetical protein
LAAFIVRIWGGENGVFQLLVEWNVDLNGLTYLDEKVSISLYNPPMCYFGAGVTLGPGVHHGWSDPLVIFAFLASFVIIFTGNSIDPSRWRLL